MKTHRVVGVLSLALLGAACGGNPLDEQVDVEQSAVKSPDIAPTGKGIGTVNKFGKPTGGGGGSNGIVYHGGPVVLGTAQVYYIWYGDWTANTATTILEDLAVNLGDTPYFGINKGYYDGANQHVSGQVVLAGVASDNYSQGTSLSDSAIQAVVENAITSNAWPGSDSDVYFVLTSADVTASSGFCTQYCGWHTRGTTLNGAKIRYAFVGNADRCPSSCAAQATGPNGNAGADAMASIIAHELAESATDPDLNAWYDRRGYENADKCAWTFGTTHTAANGAKYNVTLGARQFLLQQNWVNAAGGYCALQ